MLCETSFDLAQFDAEAPDLDLEVVASEEHVVAVGQPTDPRSPVRYMRAPGSWLKGSVRNFSAVSSGRFEWLPTPAPPMYSSPATPTGTGEPCPSNM